MSPLRLPRRGREIKRGLLLLSGILITVVKVYYNWWKRVFPISQKYLKHECAYIAHYSANSLHNSAPVWRTTVLVTKNNLDLSFYHFIFSLLPCPVPADMSSAGVEYQDLDKIGCARQFESELSLHSLALFLQSAKVRHVGTGHAWTLSPNYLYNRSLLHYYCFYYTIETFYKLNRSFQLRPQMIFNLYVLFLIIIQEYNTLFYSYYFIIFVIDYGQKRIPMKICNINKDSGFV